MKATAGNNRRSNYFPLISVPTILAIIVVAIFLSNNKTSTSNIRLKNNEMSSSQQPPKPAGTVPDSFPDLIGLSGEDAKTKLEDTGYYDPVDGPLTTIQVVPANSMVTMDYRTDRVRIFVDEKSGKVADAPRIG